MKFIKGSGLKRKLYLSRSCSKITKIENNNQIMNSNKLNLKLKKFVENKQASVIYKL